MEGGKCEGGRCERERESGDVRWERGIFISRNTEY